MIADLVICLLLHRQIQTIPRGVLEYLWHRRSVLTAVVALAAKVFRSITYSMHLLARDGEAKLDSTVSPLDISFISEITHKHKGEKEPTNRERGQGQKARENGYQMW